MLLAKVQITTVQNDNDRVNQWYNNPKDYIGKAKARARLALTDPSIKLTTLERASTMSSSNLTQNESPMASQGCDTVNSGLELRTKSQ